MEVKRISNVEWGLFLGALLLFDGIQVLLDIYVVGTVVNRYADIVIALLYGFYAFMRGLMDLNTFLALITTFTLEEIPLVDIAPFWVADGYYLMKKTKDKERIAQEEKEKEVIQKKIELEKRFIQRQQESQRNARSQIREGSEMTK